MKQSFSIVGFTEFTATELHNKWKIQVKNVGKLMPQCRHTLYRYDQISNLFRIVDDANDNNGNIIQRVLKLF